MPLLIFTLSDQTQPMWGGSGGNYGDTFVYFDSSIVYGGNALQA